MVPVDLVQTLRNFDSAFHTVVLSEADCSRICKEVSKNISKAQLMTVHCRTAKITSSNCVKTADDEFSSLLCNNNNADNSTYAEHQRCTEVYAVDLTTT